MKKKEENKNNKKLIAIIALVLLLSIIGLTLAYFVAQIGDGATANVRVTTATVDTLTFNKGSDINIGPVTQSNFADGAGNKSGSTTLSAELRANNDTNTASESYYAYLNITENTFQKTGSDAELILSITDPTGTVMNTLTGLTYTTVTDGEGNSISGFDVTESSGLITIASNYAISVPNEQNNPKTDTWNITLTFVNLDADQSENAGASFEASAIIQKSEIKDEVVYENCDNKEINNTYYKTCNSNLLACKIAKDFDSSDAWNSIVTLHNGIYLNESNSCAILDAEDNSYRYSGGDYKVTQKAIDEGYNYPNTYNGNTTGGVIGVNCNGTNQYVGFNNSTCSTARYYYLLYDTNVTQYSTYNEALTQAISDGYIESNNINNYVCFASTASTCPEDNLYRIIGAFDDDKDGTYNVKLIKADYASTTELGTNVQNGTSAQSGTITSTEYTGYKGSKSSVQVFRWYGTSSNCTNRWDNSTFRSSVLNGYYLNTYLSNAWKNKMLSMNYYLGGPGKSGYTTYTSKGFYTAERSSAAVYNTSTYPASINNYVGFMYGSDYVYASLANHWKNDNNTYYRAGGIDWQYNGMYEWTITPLSSSSNNVWSIYSYGYVNYDNAYNGYAVRPVFYLASNVEALSGNGTIANPYRIMQ